MKFFVPGLPAPGGSKKAFNWRAKDGRSGTSIVDAGGQKNKNWRAAVSYAAHEAMIGSGLKEPFRRPLYLSIVFALPRPAGHFGKHGNLLASATAWPLKRPDTTKLLRSTEDALTHIVWIDDALVVAMHITKIYASPVGAEITILEMI